MHLEELPLAYEAEGEGIPLVFIHQVGTDRRLWRDQRAHFQARYRVIAVDVLGHGESRWPKHEISIDHAASSIQRLLEQLTTGPGFLIGVSMGAAVAIRLALAAPLLVRGLVLVSPWSHANEHMRILIDRWSWLAKEGDIAAHTDLFLRYSFPTIHLQSHLPRVKRLRVMALEQNAQAVADTWGACLGVDLRGRLEQVKVPSLVIAGLHDLFTPPYLAREVADKLSDATLDIWQETGHFPFLDDPDRFNQQLETFLRRCVVQGGAG